MNKKALSPLVATILLLAFALILGVVVMNLGKNYVAGLAGDEIKIVACKTGIVQDPLKELMIQYVNGEINKEDYLQKQKALTG